MSSGNVALLRFDLREQALQTKWQPTPDCYYKMLNGDLWYYGHGPPPKSHGHKEPYVKTVATGWWCKQSEDTERWTFKSVSF